MPVSLKFLNVTSAMHSIPETLDRPGRFDLNMTQRSFEVYTRDPKAKNIHILHCDGQTVSKVCGALCAVWHGYGTCRRTSRQERRLCHDAAHRRDAPLYAPP